MGLSEHSAPDLTPPSRPTHGSSGPPRRDELLTADDLANYFPSVAKVGDATVVTPEQFARAAANDANRAPAPPDSCHGPGDFKLADWVPPSFAGSINQMWSAGTRGDITIIEFIKTYSEQSGPLVAQVQERMLVECGSLGVEHLRDVSIGDWAALCGNPNHQWDRGLVIGRGNTYVLLSFSGPSASGVSDDDVIALGRIALDRVA